jgi:predicted Zn finger-like uncharacterized protein
MILECPSCRAKYLVQAAVFAQGGRQVRCARCKHAWHATLPTTVDVFVASEATPEAPLSPPSDSLTVSANLPAVIANPLWKKLTLRVVLWTLLAVGAVLWPILDRDPIVKAFPILRGTYETLHLHVKRSGDGLIFDQVKSELRYDGGTMWLFVDGVIVNTTSEVKLLPDIKARAIGPDRHIIQSWWVEAPTATIAPGGEVPFHTQVAASMQRTIESVYLEFYAREEKGDVDQ